MGRKNKRRKRRNKINYSFFRYDKATVSDDAFKYKYSCSPEQFLLMQFHGMIKDNEKNREAAKEAKKILNTQWTYS